MDIVEQAKLLMLSLGAAPVMWLMIGLSLISIAIIVERALFFFSVRGDFARLARAFSQHLRERDFQAAQQLLEGSRALEAEVVLSGLHEAEQGPTAAREAMAGASAVQRSRMDRRLGFLGTLGNNAPFVGLFGTVIGIILAFEELAKAGASAAATTGVMSSIAEALVATAIGLFVAIPAVAAFNAFQRKIRGIVANTEALSHILLVHLEGHALPAPRHAHPRTAAAHLFTAPRAEGA
jgi:biopolymer transport protein ExbB/TolQ